MTYCNAFATLRRKESPLIVRREQKTLCLPRANRTFSQTCNPLYEIKTYSHGRFVTGPHILKHIKSCFPCVQTIERLCKTAFRVLCDMLGLLSNQDEKGTLRCGMSAACDKVKGVDAYCEIGTAFGMRLRCETGGQAAALVS